MMGDHFGMRREIPPGPPFSKGGTVAIDHYGERSSTWFPPLKKGDGRRICGQPNRANRTVFAILTALLLWMVAASGFSLPAYADVAVPSLKTRVTDLTGTLTQAQQQSLDQTLAAFEQKKGSQIAVLLVPTTKPETIEQYSIRVVDQWKLGRKSVDDGALLLVAKNDHRVRIEVGYGLEGVLPDAIANRIIDEIIVPRFKHGDFYGGIQAGVAKMIGVVSGEPLPPPKSRQAHSGSSGNWGNLVFLALFIVVFLGSILRAMFGRFFGAGVVGGVLGLALWLLAGSLIVGVVAGVIGFVINMFGGVGRGVGYGFGGFPIGGFGGYRGGGGFGGGGFGGGGFSGGGGGFGGGGASGSW